MFLTETFHVFWQEWENGSGGRKAAKLFISAEREHMRHKYSRRKYVWLAIQKNIDLGKNHMTIIDMIYNQYRRDKHITQIINMIQSEACLSKQIPNVCL